MNLLRIVIHYSKYSKSVQNVVVHYIFSTRITTRSKFTTDSKFTTRTVFSMSGSLGWSRPFSEQIPSKLRANSELSGPVRSRYPPYRAIPFQDSIAEGSIAWGVSHLHFACSPKGQRSERGSGYRTQLAVWRHPKFHGAQ